MKTTKLLPANFLLLIIFIFSFFSLALSAANPDFSNYFRNLTVETNNNGLEIRHPEEVIVGNTIHTIWLGYKANTASNVYYRRSLDLGKTWEAAQLIFTVKDNGSLHNSFTRALSVENNTVHICIPDYDYAATGTGYLHYFRSTNNGSSFENDKIIANTGGGYTKFYNSIIKTVGSKLVIGNRSAKDGIHLLISKNNGDTFKDTIVAKQSGLESDLMDLYYDGNQIIVLHQYVYYYYGFNVGRMYVSVSNDNGLNFKTTKISKKYPTATDSLERSTINIQETNFQDFQSHIAVSGNNIYILFEEFRSPNWYVMYVRSTDKGETFEKVKSFDDTQTSGLTCPSLLAKNNYVYVTTKIGSKIMMKVSSDYGANFSIAKNHFETGFYYDVRLPERYYLMTDTKDATGATVHLVGNTHFLATSTDGGMTFTNLTSYSFCFNNIYMNTQMLIDAIGVKHWFIIHKPLGGTYSDLFYRQTGNEPMPGIENKAWEIKKARGNNTISMAIANSPSLKMDSLLSIGMWLKFHPERTGNSPIFRKIKSALYYDDIANGNQIAYRTNSGKIKFYCTLKTDKGDFVSVGKKEITDSLWHYIAYTYDANGDLNNFKVYVDGILDVQQPATGKIDAGEGIICLGPTIESNYYSDIDYQLDNLKIWNKSLTMDEIQSEMNSLTNGNDSNLKLFINFDGTFKDMSGNGNDGIPMLMVENKNSNFSPPITNFDMYQTLSDVSLNNKTTNGISYQWNFGNSQTNTQPNPKYSYTTPGEYKITLLSKNDNSVTSLSKSISIKGLDKILPTSAGNKGTVTLDVYGGALSIVNTSILLRKTGQIDVVGNGIFDVGKGIVQTKLSLAGLQLGAWDVVVKTGNAEQILPSAFTVKEAMEAAPWVNISGREAVILNKWQTFTINYGNKGNVDAFAVPIWLAITEDAQLGVDFLDFKMELPEYWQTNPMASDIMALGKYFIADSIDNVPAHDRVYPFMIPVVRSNSTGSLRIRVKTPKNMNLHVWTNPAWLLPEDVTTKQKVLSVNNSTNSSADFDPGCVIQTLGMGVLDATTSVLPDVGCVWGGMKIAYTVYNHATAKASERPSIWNTIWNVGLSVTDCGISLAKNAAFPIKWGLACINLINAGYDLRKCYLPKDDDNKKVRAVSSFDPNEMIGPNGYEIQKWIQPQNVIPYTILYENKSTASAPAHTVIVIDTLDTNTFNLSDFSFRAFGWGDTIINFPQTKLREFSLDIDLRPKKELIARASGKLDSIKGIVRWEILSLNPITMDEEEDPFLGFLPPNVSSNQGEGFVSFSVGLKSGLPSNHAVKNKATIIFDANAPILTNEYTNTLDLEKPQSSVTSLEAISGDEILVKWGGNDSGSGVKSYSIWVQKGNEYPEEWLYNKVETTAVYKAIAGFDYKFYSLATDNVDRTEIKTNQFDAQLFFSSIARVTVPKEELSVYPNPAKDFINIKIKNAPFIGEYVLECFGMNGINYFKNEYETNQIRTGIQIPVDKLPEGEYIIRVLYGGNTVSRKVSIE